MLKITSILQVKKYYIEKEAGSGCALSAHETMLLSASLINQRDKIYRADIPQKSRIGTLSPSRAVARNLQARRISSGLPRASRRLFKHEIESYNTRPAVAEQFFLFNASSPVYLISRSFLNCVPSLAEPPHSGEYFLLKGQRMDAEILPLAFHVSTFDRSQTRARRVHTVDCIDHVYCRCLVMIA